MITTTTPTVTQASATLNVGQKSSVMKSGTRPPWPPTICSLRFPTAPPAQTGADGERHGADLGDDEGQDYDTDAEEDRHRDACPLNRLNANPEIQGHGQAHRPPDVAHVVEMTQGERRGHPVHHHHHGGDGKRQHPRAGQRRNKPPLLQATQRRA